MYGASIRPARFWYWVAACLLAAALACVALAVASFVSLAQQIRDFQRVRVPGQAVLTLDQGGYLMYVEGPGFATASRTGTVRVLIQAADGRAVRVSALHGQSESFDMTGHSGQAVASFTIARPGRYVLSAGLPSSPAPSDIAVGRGIGGGIGATVTLMLVAVFALGPAGIAIAVIVIVRRRRSRRMRAGPPGLPGPMPPPGPYYAPSPPSPQL